MKNNYQHIKKPSKVQQLMRQINELLAIASHMQLANIQRQIDTSSKIVGELLQNDYLSQIRSMPLLKYITYELIIKLAERAQTQQNNILLSQSNFQSQTGTIDAYDSKIRSMLYSLQQLLQEISWQYPVKTKFSKVRTQKNINSISNQPVSKIPYYQKQIANMMNEYQVCYRNLVKMEHWASGIDEQGQTALIEQLEELVAKKQEQINDMESQLEKQRAQYRDIKIFLGNLQQQKILSNKQLTQFKNENNNLKSEIQKLKRQQRNLMIEIQEKEKRKNRQQEFFQIPYPQISIDSKPAQKEDLMRFLYIQAISIDALIE